MGGVSCINEADTVTATGSSSISVVGADSAGPHVALAQGSRPETAAEAEAGFCGAALVAEEEVEPLWGLRQDQLPCVVSVAAVAVAGHKN